MVLVGSSNSWIFFFSQYCSTATSLTLSKDSEVLLHFFQIFLQLRDHKKWWKKGKDFEPKNLNLSIVFFML